MANEMLFVSRTVAPLKGDKFYTHYRNGGYNTCIVLDSNSGDVLPNCVGYAHGRYLEEHNITKCDWKLPNCNAEDWYQKAKDNGFIVGQTPKLGSVIVWSKGKLRFGSDGAGHVAVVEKINADGSIVVSESGYKTFRFRTSTIPKGYALKGYKFEGFIYPRVEFFTEDTKNETVDPNPTTIVMHKVVKGDTLWNLAKYYLGSGTRYGQIKKENNLTTNTIKVGQVLKITIK